MNENFKNVSNTISHSIPIILLNTNEIILKIEENKKV